MSKGIIRLKEVLELMETATEPFSVKYVACNKKKKSGGRIVHLESCFQTGDQPKKANPKPSKVAQEIITTDSRKPNHFENYTRNFKVMPSGQIRKCSIWLIIEFNGMKVII